MSIPSSASRPPLPCPRCGGPRGRPFAGSALCQRCATERILTTMLDGEENPAPVPVGIGDSTPESIGPYTIIGELGRGGMGAVFLAQHAQLGRIVALKAIPCRGAASSTLEIRFLREARTIAALRHPHIVTVHDAGRTDTHAYFAMDYLEDGDLAQRLRQQRQFEPRAAARLLQQVAAAIACSHAEGVLHRDLKPSNILLAGDEPRVADFGLAAQLEPGGDLTGPLVVLGTPHYSAPEILRGGGEPGVAADIYALGVILYELLAGRTPFAGAAPRELLTLVHTTEPPPLRLLAPHVPRDLETICRCCLEPEAARRYSSASALAEDLRRFLAGESIVARPASAAGQAWRWARRRPQLAAVWVLSFLLAVGSTIAAVALDRARRQTATEARRAEDALATARRSEALARTRLRGAKFAEARARRGTTEPGRRHDALAALAEAAAIRPGADLRDEALATLLLPEFAATRHWALQPDTPVAATPDPTGRFVIREELAALGGRRGALSLHRWGETAAFARLDLGDSSPLSPVRFSNDGALVAIRLRNGSVRVWRTADASLVLTLPGLPPPDVERANKLANDDVDFTADGAAICVGLDGGGLIWSRIVDGAELARSPGSVRFTKVRCSPDGQQVAACSSTSGAGALAVYVFSAPGAPARLPLPLTSLPLAIAWSPDSRLLAVAQLDDTVTTFDVRDGRIVHAFVATVRESRDIAFLGGGEFVALASTGSSVHVFNVARGVEECTFPSNGPSELVRDATGGSLFISSLEAEITRWDLRAPIGLQSLTLPRVLGYEVSGDAGGIDFSDNGRWVATAHGRYAAVREVDNGAFAGEVDGGDSAAAQFSSVMFDLAGTALLQCSTAHGLQRHPWRIEAGGRIAFAPAQVLDAEPGFVLTARTADRHRVVLINRDSGDVKVLDLTDRAPQLVCRWRTPGVYHGSLSPDGSQLLLNCSGLGPAAGAMRLSVHRVADGQILAEPAAAVSCDTAWSADGRTVLTSNGQTESIVWNAASWTRRAVLPAGLGGNTTSFALSPDGAFAVVCRETRVHLIDTHNGTVRATVDVPGAPGLATAVKFLPDGRRFGVLWPDGRLDIFAPDALLAALATHQIR